MVCGKAGKTLSFFFFHKTVAGIWRGGRLGHDKSVEWAGMSPKCSDTVLTPS